MKVIAPGLHRDWLYDQRLVVYSLTQVNAMTIRMWSDEALKTIEAWSKQRPYLALHDLSEPGMSSLYLLSSHAFLFNPVITAQASTQLRAKILAAHPDFHLYLAVLLAKEDMKVFSPNSTKPFTSREPAMITALFFDRAEAIQWLADMGIPPHQQWDSG